MFGAGLSSTFTSLVCRIGCGPVGASLLHIEHGRSWGAWVEHAVFGNAVDLLPASFSITIDSPIKTTHTHNAGPPVAARMSVRRGMFREMS